MRVGVEGRAHAGAGKGTRGRPTGDAAKAEEGRALSWAAQCRPMRDGPHAGGRREGEKAARLASRPSGGGKEWAGSEAGLNEEDEVFPN